MAKQNTEEKRQELGEASSPDEKSSSLFDPNVPNPLFQNSKGSSNFAMPRRNGRGAVISISDIKNDNSIEGD